MTTAGWDPSALSEEASYFHRVIFGTPAPAEVAERYVRLHEICFPNPPMAEKETTDKIVSLGLDAEAIECALRLRGRNHLLTRKMHALMYLVEVRREYYPRFFNEQDARIRGKILLLRAILRGLLQLMRGTLLIRRYRLG